MSKGPGKVQRAITAAFEAEPARRFTIEELASVAYPGEAIGRPQTEAVRRALKSFELAKCRVGRFGEPGWRYRVQAA